ncbi:hypothetical protein AAHK07_02060 [Aliarcobacter cryaerophilus]|uniref:hypothetical protein n=1 Tax=Aliarcobacter cryaerophilus TaxID=28198 RepID=UPI00317A1A97
MITKEQWEKIKRELSGVYGSVKFKVDETELFVKKGFIAENKLAIMVYIDEIIQIGAGWTDSKVFNPITQKVWCTKTRSVYKPKEKEKLIKIWGKREAYRMHDLDEKIVSYVPYFGTYATFERQYKKLENLELITEL